MKTKTKPNGIAVRHVTFKGKPMVMMDEVTYQAILQQADLWEPELPTPDADGNYTAREYVAALQALDILRDRRRLGLTQVELARRAGIRVETLRRIEKGEVRPPNTRIINKIDQALNSAKDIQGSERPKGPSNRK